ncbi:hypothetical protein AVEN_3136-1 [Araneus ventricosus]|uniref:Uncharacterized protein n=1 Tax=Araneus ventricosus TaxID=182803 RepID=A0A4Y2JV11_ARAVE|nr:hypothetical protein AVEN_3136-1 [Araneus ventricosus]
MRKNTAFCRILSLVTKHGVTTLNRKASKSQEQAGKMRTSPISKEIKGRAHQFTDLNFGGNLFCLMGNCVNPLCHGMPPHSLIPIWHHPASNISRLVPSANNNLNVKKEGSIILLRFPKRNQSFPVQTLINCFSFTKSLFSVECNAYVPASRIFGQSFHK